MGNRNLLPALLGWCVLALTIASLTSCSSSSSSELIAPGWSPAEFELNINDASFIDGGKAVFTLSTDESEAETVVVIEAHGAAGLKAAYADVLYDAESYTPLKAEHSDALGAGAPVLSTTVMGEPGVVHLGQIIAGWPGQRGFTDESRLVSLHFAHRPAGLDRTTTAVPTSDYSRTTLVWDDETGELIWRYYSQGDYNQDGFITVSDLTPLGQHYNAAGPFDPDSAIACVDGNADGYITVSDITPIGANFGNMVTGYAVYGSTVNDYPTGNDEGNGSAVQRGWVEFTAAERPEDERLVFRFTVPEPRSNELFRVRPSNGIEEGTPSTITSNRPFGILVTADVTSGAVPFLVNLAAEQVEFSGLEPIAYHWEFFDDETPAGDAPTIGNPPVLSPQAAITPAAAGLQNVTVHIGNTAGAEGAMSYAVRCTAVDARGIAAQSIPLRIIAEPGESGLYYRCEYPQVTAELQFPVFTGTGESANPVMVELPEPEPWTPRANPAVCTHPAGISFILGGEILDADGEFAGLIGRGDSAYAYLPRRDATATDETMIGKYTMDELAGTMIRLSDWTGPAFPNSPQLFFSPQWPNSGGDTYVPFAWDYEIPYAKPMPVQALRSAPFIIVGSAAAVLVHERPETNPAGAYPDRGVCAMYTPPPEVKDRDHHDMMETLLWSWPDAAVEGWNAHTAMCGSVPGAGAPAVYVIGGRTGASTPVNLIQKYLPWGFGSEILPPWSEDYSFQTTCNQTNIWSPYFLRPDTDQFPGESVNHVPAVPDRMPGGEPGNEQVLPHLPTALYGLMAVKLESGVDVPYPVFPNGPVNNIYVFGGIDGSGTVSSEARIWDFTRPATPAGDDELVFTPLSAMPTPRAYGQAVLIPTEQLRIVLAGGTGPGGEPLNTIDIFTFDNIYNPVSGSWSTFAGTLPEALSACGAGYLPQASGDGITAFGGLRLSAELQTELSFSLYTVPLAGPNEPLVQPLTLIPRAFAGTGQAGSYPLTTERTIKAFSPVSFDRYYVFGGWSNSGMTAAVEVFGFVPATP